VPRGTRPPDSLVDHDGPGAPNAGCLTERVWWQASLISLGVLVIVWLGFLAYLAIARPDTGTLAQIPRVLPDTIRLVRRLASDRSIPRSARLPVWVLLAYLACPIDLVPDFLPVIGYADDAILTALVLRRLVRYAGPTKVAEQWPGTPEGLTALRAMLRLDST
jgi:uncharacterized membrane protein YkvA (DUF1232 family)